MIEKILFYYKKYREIINYLIFGVLTTILNLLSYYFLTYTILNPNVALHLQVANVISWIISVVFAYITNRKYVFNSTNDNFIKEIIDFVSARIITLLLDMAIMFIGVILFNFNDKIIKILSQVLVIISNYIFSKIFVFKK